MDTIFVVVFNAGRFEPAGVIDCGLAATTGARVVITTADRFGAGAVDVAAAAAAVATVVDGRFVPAGDGCFVFGDGRLGDERFVGGRVAAAAAAAVLDDVVAAARCCFLSAMC